MKNYYVFFFFVAFGFSGYTQVGIGTTTPNESSQLEVVATNKGILIPRVLLKSTKDTTTISSGNVESLLVFNTQTIADVIPGYYYWYIDKWNRLGATNSETITTIEDKGNGVYVYTNEIGVKYTINVAQGPQGKDGKDGASIRGGDGAPGKDTGSDGDTYIDNSTGDVYYKEGDVWNIKGNIKGPKGDSGTNGKDGLQGGIGLIENGLNTTVTGSGTVGSPYKINTPTSTLINNNDGSYNYNNEEGVNTKIDVVGDVVTNIKNEGPVYNEIVNLLNSKSDKFADNGNGTFTHTTVDGKEVIFDANTTTVTNNGDGTYTVTNKKGDTVKIDVVGDVVTNIKNEGPVYNEIVNLLNSKSDKFADNGNGTFTHTTVDGKEVIFDANTTTVTNNGDGTYTVTNKKGDTVKIDVVGDVVTNIKNEGPVYNEIVNLLNSKSDKFADNGNGTFTHTTVDGKEVIFDANTTTVTNNGDGTYTVTNKKGDTVKIDVVGDVVTNIKNEGPVYNEIVNLLNSKSDKFADNGNGTFTHTTVDGKEVIFDANTTTVTNNGDGTYTVTNKKGDTVKIDVVGDVVTNIKNEGPVYNEIVNLLNSKSDKFADNGNGTFTHTTVDGKEVIFDANTTTVTNNGDGTYTVTNKKGDTVKIDVVGDVVTNIKNEGPVYNEIVNLLNSKSDKFADNGNGTFTHTTVDGKEVIFDANTTTVTNNGDGTYTVTNKKGETVKIDVVGDVVTNIKNEGPIYNEIVNLLNSKSDKFADNGNGTFTHTTVDGKEVIFDANTTTVTNNGDGTYTVTNKKGETVKIDVVGDVVTNIKNEGPVYNEIVNLLNSKSDKFADNGNGTFTHTTVDGKEVIFDANTTTVTNNGDGTYTVTNKKGETVKIDVVGDVVTNIKNEGPVYNEIVNLLNSKSDKFADNGNGTFTHTTVDGKEVIFDANTTTVTNNGDGTYTVTNKKGETVKIDVVGDVVTNIKNEGPIYNEIVNLLNSKSDKFADNGNGTFTHTTVDGKEVIFDANTTTVTNNGDGTYTVTNKKGETVKIDVVGDVVTNIKNEGPVYNEIVNLLNSKSDKFADNGNGTFTHTTVDGKEVIFDANTTTVTNNGDGTYTVTNKKGDTVKIDVVGDVVTNIKNEGPVYNEIVNLLNSKSDKFADNGNGTFTHTTVDGKEVIFDANTTTVTNNGDGTYTVTNKKGDTVKIDVVGDVVTNIKNEGPVYNEIVNLLNSKSDKFADNGNGTFTHTTVDGKEVIFDANTTTVTNNGDGTYTVTNKKGETVKIDVVGDVVTNIKNEGPIYNEIVNLLNSKSDKFADNGNGTFTHTTVDGKEVIFDANTTTVTNNGDGTYTVTNKKGETVKIDVVGDVVTNIKNEGPVYNEIVNLLNSKSDKFADNGNGTFTHTTVDGKEVIFDANTTTVTNNGDGTYTVTNKKGETVKIDVVGDVVTNIKNEGPVYNEIVNLLNSKSDKFADNGNGTFTHTTVDGKEVIFDANTTTVTNNGDGTYTVTNKKGETVKIDVVGDVVTNIKNEGPIYNEIVNLLNSKSDKFADNGNGTFTHTTVDGKEVIFDANTTTVTNNGDGTYTVTNKKGETVKIDVVGDVVTNIKNEGPVYNEIVNLLNSKSDKFADNGNGTFTHTTVDGKEVIFDANTTTVTNNGDGTYTVTNKKGETVKIDVVGDVVTNIKNEGPVYNEIINILTSKTDKLVNNGDGTLTHTSVDGKEIIFTVTRTGTGVPAPGGKAGDIYVDNSTGDVYTYNGTTWIKQGDLATMYANNGLSVSSSNAVQLGGSLIKATEITTTATNTLAITGLQPGAVTDGIVVNSSGGVLKTIAPSDLLAGATTHTFDNDGVNTLTSIVNGITEAAPAVNTVGNAITDATLTTTVNGVSGTALDLTPAIASGTVNALANDGTNTITSTVNGKVATAPAVNTVGNAITDATLTTTVNGVSGTALDLTPAIASGTVNALANDGTNTITSTVNGKVATAPAVNTNTLALTGTVLNGSVNGVSSTVDLQSAITGGTTHTFDNDGVNTLTSVVNGITEAAPAVNTVGNAITDATLTTTVNGVSGIALDLTPAIASGTVNALANDGTNTITSTVNGKVATAPAVNTVGNAITDATLTTTVNGVSGTALDLTPAIASGTVNALANDGTNTITSTVNGKVATAPAVNTVGNAIANATLTTTVNGVSGTALDLTPAIASGTVNALANDGTNTITSTVNGKVATAPAVNTNTLGLTGTVLNGSVNGVSSTVDLQSAITGGTTHTFDNDGVNTLTSVVNGITEAAPAVNTVGNAIIDATLTTTVNGVSGTALDLTPAIASGTVNVLANDGTNTITSTVNGKVATAPAVNTNTLGLTGTVLNGSVNGVSSTVDLQSAITGGTTHTFDNDGVNTLTSVVNGITEAAPAVNTVGNAITNATLTTTVNGVSGTALDLTPAIASGTVNALANDGTNTITSTVNGKVATAPAVNTVGNAIANATLTTTVNGVSGTALDLTPAIASGTVNALANDGTNTIISTVNGKVATAPAVNTVDATLVNGVLTSKVNGVSDATPVNVLATANSGLTATNGNVQLGGALLEAEAIGTTAANTLAITGLATGATTDAIVVSSTGGVLKTIPTTALATEPWRVQGGLLQATSNNDKIYQNNNVAIGKNSGFAPAALDVNGAIRGGLNNATTTVGLNSIAVGANNVASGQHSVAFGAGASATGTGSFALTGGVANGSYSIATATPGGFTNIASNEGAKAFGQSSTASGAYSLSTGLVTIASGDYSTAFGTSSESIGSGSFAGGSSSIARGLNSLAFGFQVEAANNNEAVFGIDNAIKTSVGDVTDPIFQIGIGTNNGLTILQNGNAAIGVNGTEAAAKPTERLDIGSGGVKIRDINAAPYIGDVTTDRLVVASTTGILKTITPAAFLNGATTVDATLANGFLTSTVNGVADLTPVNVLSTANNGLTTTNGNVVLGGTLTASTTTITTNAATNQLAIAGLAAGVATDAIVVSSTGGVLKTITSSALVSGGSTNLFSSSGNILTSNVNGISRTAPAVNAVDATLANGVLTSTVNGVADLTPVNVLSTANSGLTATNGNVQLGGALLEAEAIGTTATNTLAITGLQTGGTTDAVVVSSTGGVLKTVPTSTLSIEPWLNQTGGTQATANNQNIYQIGNVAIGATTIPTLTVSGATVPVKFHVEGNMTTTGKLYTTSSVYADYVFDKYFDGYSNIKADYKFTPLNEVAAFVKANKHLPGVTPINEVSKDGIGYKVDMTTLTMQSLEKIEELYLHVIEQQKQIEAKDATIDTLKKDAEDMKARVVRLEELLLRDNK